MENKFRQIALELADLAHMVCEKNNINYTLLDTSLLGATKYKGFLPWDYTIKLGMLYDDFKKFKLYCKKEIKKTNYYIMDSQKCDEFEEPYIRLCKKSNVILPDDRKKDEVYYDYYIDIIPIFYAGNIIKSYKRHYKEIMFNIKCLSTFRITPGTVKLKNLVPKIKQAYFYSKRSDNNFIELKKKLLKYDQEETKFVILPIYSQQNGCVRLARTYNKTKDIEFEGRKYRCIVDSDSWIDDFYTSKELEETLNKQVNKSKLDGPEILRRVQLIELEMLVELDRICRKYDLNYVLAAGTLLGAVRHKGFIPWDDDIDVFMLYKDYKKFLEIAPNEIDKEKFFIKTIDTDEDCNLTFAQLKRNNTIFQREGRYDFNTHKGVFIDILPLFNGSRYRTVHYIQHKVSRFFKTATWAHIGAESERKPIKRWYYRQLAKITNKKSYDMFLKVATMIKTETDNLAYLSVARNPKNNVMTSRSSYENRIEILFEGKKFYAPKNYHEMLSYIYSEDYLRYPILEDRQAKHLPAKINIGKLYEDLIYEDELYE